jgi:hypothetical protein
MDVSTHSVYEIRVGGDLDPSWSDRLSGMKIRQAEAGPPVVTLLTGELPDQSALQGIMNTLFELHLPILSTECISRGEESLVKGRTR